MKNILVPTDFSAESHNAYTVALQWARHTGGSVTLLHVLEALETSTANFSSFGGPVNGAELPNSMGDLDELFTVKLMEVTKHRMHAMKDEAASVAPGVAVQDTVEVARIGDGILAAIEKHHIDLVVVGAQGHGAMEGFFVGSTTERMIRLAPCPVLTVKALPAQFEVHNIVFPSDFKDDAATALEGLRQVVATFPGATLHMLHIISDADDDPAQEQIQAFAQQAQLTNYKVEVIGATNTSTGIDQFAKQVNADLIVIPTHARSGLSRFLHTSIAETVATHAFPPVLTYHY